MCGIIAAFNTDIKKKGQKKIGIEQKGPVNGFIINQYEDQHLRGTQGFGIISINEKLKIEVQRATEPIKFLLDLYQFPSKMIIAHHRMPTSTENKLSQTHPMFVANKMLEHSYLVIHNGIVNNADELKIKHEALGFKYTTEHEEFETTYGYTKKQTTKFNDSESLAIELALFAEGKIHTIGTPSNAAFIMLQIDKTGTIAQKVYYGRKTTPLNMAKTRGQLRLSSEGPGNAVEEGNLYSFDIKDTEMKLTKKKLPFIDYKPLTQPATTLWNNDGSLKSLEERTTSIIETTPSEKKESKTEEMSDEKYILSERTRFKATIKEKDAEEIQCIYEEFIEEYKDHMSEMIHEFANACTDSTPEMPETTTYLYQLNGYMETMKAITTDTQAELAITEKNETKNLEDQKEFARNWHKHNPHIKQGGFGQEDW